MRCHQLIISIGKKATVAKLTFALVQHWHRADAFQLSAVVVLRYVVVVRFAAVNVVVVVAGAAAVLLGGFVALVNVFGRAHAFVGVVAQIVVLCVAVVVIVVTLCPVIHFPQHFVVAWLVVADVKQTAAVHLKGGRINDYLAELRRNCGAHI